MATPLPHAWCPLPWMHGYVSPDGHIRPCCSTDVDTSIIGSLDKDTLDSAMTSDPLIMEMRRQMMAEQRPDVCKQCYAVDDGGGYSYREWATKQWGHLRSDLESRTSPDGGLDRFDMLYMDVRPSNLCNLMCRTCSPYFSSAIASDLHRQGETYYTGPVLIKADGDGSRSYLSQLMEHIDHVEEVYFAGGEPLLMEEHRIILEELLRRGRTDVVIRYSTNMSVLDRKHVIDLWKRFGTVKIVASIDSWGDRAEYIRRGSDWGKIQDNMLVVRRDAPNVFLTINTVVSVFNFLTMREFWLHLYDCGILSRESYGSSWTKLYYHPSMRMNNLPLADRRNGILAIEDLVERLKSQDRYVDGHMEGFRDYLDMWNHEDLDGRETAHMISDLDRQAGTRCHDVFPELAAFLSGNGYE